MSDEEHILNEMLHDDKQLTDKQKSILIAATEIFAEKGFAGTSTKEIAQKAGVAEGTIFRHYKTKKDLLLSIVSPLMVKMLAPMIIKDINKVLDQDFEHFEDFLHAMIQNRQKFLEKNLKVLQIFIQEIPFHEDLRNQFIEHVGKQVVIRFIQIIEHYQAKEQIYKWPATTCIRLIVSTLVGHFAAKYLLAAHNDWNDQNEIDQTVQFIAKGLAPD